MTNPYSSPNGSADADRSPKPHVSRTAWISFAMFATIHTLVMLPVGVEGYGVPIGSLMLWMLIDFPISWVIVIGGVRGF